MHPTINDINLLRDEHTIHDREARPNSEQENGEGAICECQRARPVYVSASEYEP